MKKIKNSILAILFTIGMMIVNISPVLANSEYWNDSIYHFNDTQDVVSDEEHKAENALVNQAIDTAQFDISTFIIDDTYYDEIGFDGYLDTIYEQNDMGYGINHDGAVLGMDAKNQTFLVRAFGRGQDIFRRENMDIVNKAIQIAYTQNGYLAAQQAFRENVVSIVTASDIVLDENEHTYSDRYSTNILDLYNKNYEKLPDWYVTDPSNFQDFHNDLNTSRVIDNAGILNAEDIQQLQTTIKEIYETDHQDIVVYTDVTSYGLDNELYAQDFYVYNGYGYGDNFDGLILFVNMDPDNREMVTSACGSSRDLFSQSFLSSLDDILYDHFVNKEYGAGVCEWIKGVQNITHYGLLNIPTWYKDYLDGTTPKDANTIKLVDDLNYFDEATYAEITNKINELKEQYGYEIVVYLTDNAYNLSEDYLEDKERVCLYADTFYETQGYDKDGILLSICVNESSIDAIYVRKYGETNDIMSDKVAKRLASLTLTNLGSGNYEKNINRYLNFLEKFLRTGRLPHTTFVRVIWLILCTLVGAILGSGKLATAKAKMKTVKKAENAYKEMVPNSLKVHRSNNVYLTTTVDRVYSPEKRDSGSSGSSSGSSRSSYSSSSHSSSGRSFSSSRRKF